MSEQEIPTDPIATPTDVTTAKPTETVAANPTKFDWQGNLVLFAGAGALLSEPAGVSGNIPAG
jgi:hypothetical protein